MTELSHIFFTAVSPPTELTPAKLSARSAPRNARGANSAVLQRNAEANNFSPAAPLIHFVLGASGIDETAYQPKVLQRRLGACLRTLGAKTEAAAITVLQNDPTRVPEVLSSLLIGVSSFFRDPEVFVFLQNRVFPDMIKEGGLRVCSYGCSAGQELYSAAIILDELGALPSSQLLGVDCRPGAVAQARGGCFDLSELEGVGPARRARYFEFHSGRPLIAPRLREHLRWELVQAHRPEPGVWDVIFFRNLSIYLTPVASKDLWRRLEQQLKPGGVMVAGKAERPPAELGLVREFKCIYRKPNR